MDCVMGLPRGMRIVRCYAQQTPLDGCGSGHRKADRITSSPPLLTLARWNPQHFSTLAVQSVSHRRDCRVIAASGEGKPL